MRAMRWFPLVATILLTALLAASSPVRSNVVWSRCTDCHEIDYEELPPISALRPEHLMYQPSRRCEECHSSAELKVPHSSWTHPVRPVGLHVRCTACHQAVPHSATEPPPMPSGEYEVEGCYECHRGVEIDRHLASRHAEADVHCRDCHPAHDPLLVALPGDFLPAGSLRSWSGAYDWWTSNDQCLTCHEPVNLLMSLDQGFIILNTTNYHDTHVTGAQVLCLECHTPHGSIYDSLLRTQLLNDNPLLYGSLADGGTCSVICHGINHDNWQYTNRVY